MSQKIVRVAFTQGNSDALKSTGRLTYSQDTNERLYEYIAPESAKGTENYAVITSGKQVHAGTMKIVRIVEWVDFDEKKYEGDLKHVVAVFDTRDYTERVEKAEKKKALLHRIKNKLSERSLVAQLESLAGDDEEALSLIRAYKELG